MPSNDPNLIQLIIGPLIGSFFGVALGLFLNKYIHFKSNKKTRLFYLTTLRKEVDSAIPILVNDTLMLVSENAFRASLYNASPSIFEPEEIYELSKVTFQMQAFNNEAERLINAIHNESFEQGKDIAKTGRIEAIESVNLYIIYMKKKHLERSKDLLKSLQALKYKDWFKEDKEISFKSECINELRNI
jgi:hypothetical protein